MSASAAPAQSSLSTAGYVDGLGRRTLRFDREVGGILEALELRPEFGLYEPLLREAMGRLATLTDDRIAAVRTIEREAHSLVVCSTLAGGQRLEDLLDARYADDYAGPGIDAAIGFLHQALPAVGALHATGLVHGAIAPGRLALGESGTVVLLDCLYGSALERLRLTRDRLWTSFAIAADAASGSTRFDRGTDLRQLALAAIAIALGRPLHDPCTPVVIAQLLQEVADVAQICAGGRFAADVRSLLEAMTTFTAAAPAVGEASAEVLRLSRIPGTDVCLAALAGLSKPRTDILEAPTQPSAPSVPVVSVDATEPLHFSSLLRDDESIADPYQAPDEEVHLWTPDRNEPTASAEAGGGLDDDIGDIEDFASEAPALALDVHDSVEISLDGLDGDPFGDESEEPALLVLDAQDVDSALFDWQPNTIIPARRAEPQTSILEPVTEDVNAAPRADEPSPDAFDWRPEPVADVPAVAAFTVTDGIGEATAREPVVEDASGESPDLPVAHDVAASVDEEPMPRAAPIAQCDAGELLG